MKTDLCDSSESTRSIILPVYVSATTTFDSNSTKLQTVRVKLVAAVSLLSYRFQTFLAST